jgi:hypothetical protein
MQGVAAKATVHDICSVSLNFLVLSTKKALSDPDAASSLAHAVFGEIPCEPEFVQFSREALDLLINGLPVAA